MQTFFDLGSKTFQFLSTYIRKLKYSEKKLLLRGKAEVREGARDGNQFSKAGRTAQRPGEGGSGNVWKKICRI